MYRNKPKLYVYCFVLSVFPFDVHLMSNKQRFFFTWAEGSKELFRLIVVVRLCVIFVVNMFIFFSRTTGWISAIFHKSSFSEDNSIFFKWNTPPFSKGIWIRKIEHTLTKLKTLLLQNYGPNFNKTCRKGYLGGGDWAKFVHMKDYTFTSAR